MKMLPKVWGKGALFAFSALEGETKFEDSMCGQLTAEHIGMFLDGCAAELYLRLKGIRWTAEIAFSLVASDLIEGTLNGGEEFKFVFLNQNTIVGYCPTASATPIFRCDLAEERVIDGGKAFNSDGKWYAFVRAEKGENTYFALSGSADFNIAVKNAEKGLTADMEATAEKRRSYFDMLPEPEGMNETELSALSKCFSIMKSQVYSPDGCFTVRWTTPDRLPHKKWWLWDSVFHTLGNVYIDEKLAYETLRSVLDVQSPDGFIPHMATPNGGISPHTQPPIMAWGLYRLYEKTGRRDWVKEMYGGIALFLKWIMKNRDENRNYLYEWYVDPETELCRCGESGMDNTPRFDDVLLSDSIDFSCYMANEMRHMEKLARVLGLEADAAEYARLYELIGNRVNTLLYDEADGRYYDREIESGRFRKVNTPAGFLPLFAGICPPERAEKLVADIVNPKTYGTPMPLPSVSLDDPEFCDDYWRGTTWICYNYMIENGLREYGFTDEANHMADATLGELRNGTEERVVPLKFTIRLTGVAPLNWAERAPRLGPQTRSPALWR